VRPIGTTINIKNIDGNPNFEYLAREMAQYKFGEQGYIVAADDIVIGKSSMANRATVASARYIRK